MVNLFIDTNILLNFYHFSNEDLENLLDLNKLIEGGKVKLFIPEQVIDEFKRNREVKIQDAIKRLNNNEIKSALPQMSLDYPEAEELKKAEKLFRDKKKELLEKLTKDIETESLKADSVINEIFSKNEKLITTDEIIERAEKRHKIGNPPGKKGSLGDSINWEVLLEHVPFLEELTLVSGDGDYSSALNEKELSAFLKEEWQNKKSSKINFYISFNDFLKKNFPDVKITSEDIKNAKIEAFRKSPNFDAARVRLYDLYKINEFSDSQIKEIINASLENNQIYWAHPYSPELIGVRLGEIIKGHEQNIELEKYKDFCTRFDIEQVHRHDDLPF